MSDREISVGDTSVGGTTGILYVCVAFYDNGDGTFDYAWDPVTNEDKPLRGEAFNDR